MAEKELIEQLCDTQLSVEERRRVLDELGEAHPGMIRKLRLSGRLPAVPWPSCEEGRTMGGDLLLVHAIFMPQEALMHILENAAHEEGEKVVLAARFASALARYDEMAAGELEPPVRRLLRDRRRAFPALEHNYDSIGFYVQQHHLQILNAMDITGSPRYFDLLKDAICITLERGTAVDSLFNPFLTWLRAGGGGESLTALLLTTLEDPAAHWSARFAARCAFDTLKSVAAAYPDLPAAIQTSVLSGLEKADERLLEIIRSTDEPPEVKDAILAKLHRWVPHAITSLQKEGVLAAQPVPSRRDHRDWKPDTLERLSATVSFDEVVVLLTEAREKELDRIVTSLRLIPSFISWLPGAAGRLQLPLRALISSRLEVPMKTKPLILGSIAFESFPLVFPSGEEEPSWAQDAICDGLGRAVEAGWCITPVADRLKYCCTTETLDTIGNWLLLQVSDKTRPLEQREACQEALEAFDLKALVKQGKKLLFPHT
jgi:hypothetical protein